MRINSGEYRGRKLKMPNFEGLRPTADLVKLSMFNIIGDIKDFTVLDLFCGSGSLGIESISRGAKLVYFVDSNPLSIKLTKDNSNFIQDKCIILLQDYQNAIINFYHQNIKFDLIILDPPYNKGYSIISLNEIDKSNILNDNGLIMVETECNENLQTHFNNFILIKSKKYGIKKISLYQKIANKKIIEIYDKC